jgi:hypothetical protein
MLSYPHEAEWTPFQTHYFSENLASPGIEPGNLNLYPGTLTTKTTETVLLRYKKTNTNKLRGP